MIYNTPSTEKEVLQSLLHYFYCNLYPDFIVGDELLPGSIQEDVNEVLQRNLENIERYKAIGIPMPM